MSLGVQVTHADCRIRGGEEDFGQGSSEVIGFGCLLRAGYSFPLHLLTFGFNGNSAWRVYLNGLGPTSLFLKYVLRVIFYQEKCVFNHFVLLWKR